MEQFFLKRWQQAERKQTLKEKRQTFWTLSIVLVN
jgi:hypothetical protein